MCNLMAGPVKFGTHDFGDTASQQYLGEYVNEFESGSAGYLNYAGGDWSSGPDYAAFYESAENLGLWPSPAKGAHAASGPKAVDVSGLRKPNGKGAGGKKRMQNLEPQKVSIGGEGDGLNFSKNRSGGQRKPKSQGATRGFEMPADSAPTGLESFDSSMAANWNASLNQSMAMQAALMGAQTQTQAQATQFYQAALYNPMMAAQYYQAIVAANMAGGADTPVMMPVWGQLAMPGQASADETGRRKGGGKSGGKKGREEQEPSKARGDRRRKGKNQNSQDTTTTQATAESAISNNPYLQAVKRAATPALVKQLPFSLADIKEHMVEFAKDASGSRWIQSKIEDAKEEDINIVFEALGTASTIKELAIDCFGNYVIQKLFEFGTPYYKQAIAEFLVGDVRRLSMHMYGCRVVQKALETIAISTQVLLASELTGKEIQMTEDMHGNHVIQKCIERMPPEKVQFIVDAFQSKVCRMAMHCYGCRVVQRLIEHCTQQQMAPILDEVLRNVPGLSDDAYGNYVIQHVLVHGRLNDKKRILATVKDHILELSAKKCASNVVETCVGVVFQDDQLADERAGLVRCVLHDPLHTNPPIMSMMRDKFGNYIVQRMIEFATEEERKVLVDYLKSQLPVLHKFTHGKHVLAALQPYLEASEDANGA